MARAANGRLTVLVDVNEASTGLGVGDQIARIAHPINYVYEMANGTADGSIDRVYSVSADLTTTPTDVDLLGSLSSVIGAGTTSFVDLVGIVIQHSAGTGVVQVGGDANGIPIFGAAAHYENLYEGGVKVFFAPKGVPLVAGTGDILQLATASGTATVKVVIFGRSA